MSTKSTIITPLPKEVSSEAFIKALHNHELYFKLTDPETTDSTLKSGDPSKEGDACIYTVNSKSHSTEYELTNHPEGLDTKAVVKSVAGTLGIKAKWRLAEGKLTEEIELEANFVIRKMAKGPTEKNAEESHKRFIEELTKASA